MTQPVTGSYEALWGTLAYLFQTEIASPMGLTIRSAECDAAVSDVTVWGQIALEIGERDQPRRSDPSDSRRFGRRVWANFDVTLHVREETESGGTADTRRVHELADSVRESWPAGRVLPFYDTRVEPVVTTPHGFIHIVGSSAKPHEALVEGVKRQTVRFDVFYNEESELVS